MNLIKLMIISWWWRIQKHWHYIITTTPLLRNSIGIFCITLGNNLVIVISVRIGLSQLMRALWIL